MPVKAEMQPQGVARQRSAVAEAPAPSATRSDRGGDILSRVLGAAKDKGITIGNDGSTADSAPPLRRIWIKSRRSDQGGNCVELAALGGKVWVRDSKNPDGGHLTFEPASLENLFTSIREGLI